ncbi:hypothetical protein OG689_33515 [Kitasatospora sp. NBC_00240]|uniref:hypothetical protein n=1 Tax=Kitasatospora sp. NBC_00240 TaxID=2903567 RepID=UPI0022587503|nr:hypothetical protein [Kitasatospora sp. NBC_00240]MCX5214123.1 hypothetical protein [Kitasatospora sp. NBC_00240]
MPQGKRWTFLTGRPDRRSGRGAPIAVPEVLSADALAEVHAGRNPGGCGAPLARPGTAGAPAAASDPPGRPGARLVVADAAEAVRLAAGGGRVPAVRVQLPADLPPVSADGAQLRLAVAALLEHALRRRPPGTKVLVRADAVAGVASGGAGRVEIRVVDRGASRPGEAKYWTAVEGAEGAARAAGGRLRVEETPAGGLTFVLVLRAVDGEAPERRG